MAQSCVDLSICNTVSFESTDSYVSELSWTVTSGDDILASGSGYSDPSWGSIDPTTNDEALFGDCGLGCRSIS